MQPAASKSQDDYANIRFTALLKSVGAYHPAGYKGYRLQDDLRFFLLVNVISAEPENYWFEPGRSEHLLVKDAAQLLGENPDESVGKSFRFVVRTAKALTNDMIARGEGRFRLISVTPKTIEPGAPAD